MSSATKTVASNDVDLQGDGGDNSLSGGEGEDTLSGGPGSDTLEGGQGADRFDINPGDEQITILDFELGLDTLDLVDFNRADALQAFYNAQAGSAILTFGGGTVVTVEGDGVSPETLSLDDVAFASGNLLPSGPVEITGTAEEDQVLSADDSGVNDGDGIDLTTETFQWRRDGIDIPGAESSSYTLTQEDVGSAISVVYGYTDTFGTEESVVSDPTGPVGNINDPLVGVLQFSGAGVIGETLSADASGLSDEDGIDASSVQWEWARLDTGGSTVEVISGADQPNYTVTPDDTGFFVSPRFRYTDEFGNSGLRTSIGTFVNTPPTGGVSINGTAEEGETVSADISGINEPDGLRSDTVSYQWRRDGVDIPGATAASYTISASDLFAELTVEVEYSDEGFTTETIVSDPVEPAGIPQTLIGTPEPDSLVGGNGHDTIRGLESDDTLTGNAGDDFLEGGAGFDTGVYSGDQSSYTLTLSPAATTLADRRAAGNGTDTLAGMEFLDFDTDLSEGPFRSSSSPTPSAWRRRSSRASSSSTSPISTARRIPGGSISGARPSPTASASKRSRPSSSASPRRRPPTRPAPPTRSSPRRSTTTCWAGPRTRGG